MRMPEPGPESPHNAAELPYMLSVYKGTEEANLGSIPRSEP